MAYEVPPLPYDYNALEPHIDEQTMRLHHDKHHQAYVDNANAALEGTDWADKPVEEVLKNLGQLPEDLAFFERTRQRGADIVQALKPLEEAVTLARELSNRPCLLGCEALE